MIHDILQQFNDIIVETEFLNIRQIKESIYYKCKIQLIDGSNLRISETWDEQQIIQYSYYWLDDENKLIIGWDNAPHHLQITTYPHHKHIQQQTEVYPSNENCLKHVLHFIKHNILN